MSGYPVMRSTEDAELYTTVTEREKNVRASGGQWTGAVGVLYHGQDA